MTCFCVFLYRNKNGGVGAELRWKLKVKESPPPGSILLIFSKVCKDSFYQWLRLKKVSWRRCECEELCLIAHVAAAAAKKTQRAQNKKAGHIHTTTRFYRPKTLELARKPKYVRHAVQKENKMDAYAIIKKPAVSESSMKKIEVGRFVPSSHTSV